MTYQVVVTREGDYWLADVPELVGAHTFANSLQALRAHAADVIVLAADLPDDATPEFEFQFALDDPAVTAALSLKHRREALARHQGEVRDRTVCAINALTASGFSVRDVSELVGVTPGRVSQLVPRRQKA